MSTMFNQVCEMHKKFGLRYTGVPRQLSPEERDFRIRCLQEELDEYIAAKTLEDQFDALLDLVVFALGTMERQGFLAESGFNRVMDANMAKQLATKASDSKRNFAIDLIKPPGWKAPDLRDLVRPRNV